MCNVLPNKRLCPVEDCGYLSHHETILPRDASLSLAFSNALCRLSFSFSAALAATLAVEELVTVEVRTGAFIALQAAEGFSFSPGPSFDLGLPVGDTFSLVSSAAVVRRSSFRTDLSTVGEGGCCVLCDCN